MQWTDRRTGILLVILVLMFAILAIPGLLGYGPDRELLKNTTLYIHVHGLNNAYTMVDNGYRPVYQYFLWLFGKACRHDSVIANRIGYLRIFTLMVEICGVYFVYLWNSRKEAFGILLLFAVFNTGCSYNTFIWGQNDGMAASVVFIAIYCLYNSRLTAGMLCLTVALLLKKETVILVPIAGLLLLSHAAEKGFVWKTTIAVVASVVFAAVVLIPFLGAGVNLHTLLTTVIFNPQRAASVVSQNAYNIYYWVFWQRNNIIGFSDSSKWFGGVSYHQLGLFLYFTAAIAAVFPLLLFAVKKLRQKGDDPFFPKEKIWIICSLVPMIFFFFGTNMRVTSLQVSVFFLLIYAFSTRDFIAYALFSLAFFLNQEGIMHWLRLENYDTLIFDARFIALIYFAVIFYLFLRLFGTKKHSYNLFT